MGWFDLISIVVMVVSAWQGAWRGMASQLAPIASLIVGYLVAIPLSKDMAPWFGTDTPANRFVAALVIYLAIAFVMYLVAGLYREAMSSIRMEGFDHHLGFLFGLAKGGVLCMLMAFFGIGLSEKSRQTILASRAGEVSASVMRTVEPMLPGEIRDLLDGTFDAIVATRDLLPIAPPTKPNRTRVRDEDLISRWASDWGPSTDSTRELSENPSRIENRPRQPSAFLQEAARAVDEFDRRR
ncbi:CvpA family protein [bacterium]|nr:CvpA family protein [bacterium]